METGRPPKYKSPAELQKKVDEYFEIGVPTKTVMVKDKPVEIQTPTITGMVLYLGFCDRASFYDYEKNKEFSHTLKKARARIEQHYEELVASGVTSVIFLLKNFGWRDTLDIDQNVTVSDGIVRLPYKKPVGAAVTEIAQA